MKVISTWLAAVALLVAGCSPYAKGGEGCHLSSINIIDRNGMTETVSTRDRLKEYDAVDFLTPQPFEKVIRVYGRDPQGGIPSRITSYYPNGQIKQYLEAYNGRAQGHYREWHDNGQLALEVQVVGGPADLSPGVENSWAFDGVGRAWDRNGHIQAEIPYAKGKLEGIGKHYHPDGSVAKTLPWIDGHLNGILRGYSPSGGVQEESSYSDGLLHGKRLTYWPNGKIAADEYFQRGRLLSGTYLDPSHTLLAEVKEGAGHRALFESWGLSELRQVVDGREEGRVQIFNEEGALASVYHIKNGLKHGEEVEYAPSSQPPRPRLSIHWSEGNIQGLVRSWYPNGNLESQREMSNNHKQGTSTAWYEDGSLMLVEEYDRDRLLKAKYLRRGERLPVSEIVEGKGTATLFDSQGHYLKKINYQDGVPIG